MKPTSERPLKHRPGVEVITRPDGKRHVLSDGNPFSGAELMALGTVIEPTSSRPPLTAEERAEIEAAEERLAEALALVDRAHEAMDEAHARGHRFEASLGKIGEREAARIKQLRAAHDAARAAWHEAREVEGLARVELTNVSRRADQAARMRVLTAEQAERPPARDERPLGERMAGLAALLRG
jgi:hypothetical protein